MNLNISNIEGRKNVRYHIGGDLLMEIINITNLRKNIYRVSESVVNDGVIYNVSCKDGNLVMLSKDEYDALMETIYLSSNPEIKKSLLEGKKASHEEMIKEEDVPW